MKIKLAILFLGMLYIACNSGVKPAKNADTLKKRSKALSNFPEPKWLDSPRLVLAIDTNLTHKRTAFRCDSVIIMSYKGSFGENFYLPVNEKGQCINTIKKKKKLSAIQFKKLNAIIGNAGSFKNPVIISCYEPRIGVLYYKGGKLIGQSAICLDCARVQSSAKLGNNWHYSSLNKNAVRKLGKFYDSLKM